MSFWAVEITPGAAFETSPPYDLHVTQIVLPAGATDKGRTVVSCTVGDKSFALGSLKLDLCENIHTDLIFDADVPMQLSIALGKNPVQLIGYYVDQANSGMSDDDLSDDEGMGMYGGMDDMEGGSDDSDDEEIDEDEISDATLQALKRKATTSLTNGTKKPKVEEPKKVEQKPQQPKGEQKPQQPKGEQKPQQPKGEQKPQTPKGEQKPQQQKKQTPAKEQTPKAEGSAQKGHKKQNNWNNRLSHNNSVVK